MKKVLHFFLALLLGAASTAHAAVQQATPSGGPSWSGKTASAVDNFAGGVQTDVVVNWDFANANGNAITGYQVLAYVWNTMTSTTTLSGASCSTGPTVQTCTVKGLAFATYYRFRVVATNAVGSAGIDTTNTQNGVSVRQILTPGLDQTVTISNNPSSYTFGSPDFKLSATATSGLPITWTSSPTSTCTVDSTGLVHFLKAQLSCRITATQYGASAGYNTASAFVDDTAGIAISVTANSATAVQGTSASLNGVFPYPGADVTPSFCIKDTNPGTTGSTTCTGSLGTMGTFSTPLIGATTATTSTATVTGLLSGHQYWYWAIATAGVNVAASNVVTFTTQTGPTLTLSGAITGTVGSAMSATFTATGGSGTYTTWDKGTLPAGLSINYTANSAVISGTPTTAGSTVTWVYVQDSGGLDTTLPVTFVITDSAPMGGGGGGGGGGGSAPTPTATPTPTVEPSLEISLNDPTNIQSTSAELNGSAKWLGIDGTPQFCISTVNDNTTCSIVTGATISPLTPSFITSNVNGAIVAKIVGLKPQTTYYVWACISGSGKTEKTATRTFKTAAGPSLNFTGETRIRVGGNLRLVVTASSGVAPYKNWQITGLPTGIISIVDGANLKISGKANLVSTFNLDISVLDANKDQGLLTIPVTFFDEASNLAPLGGVTSQVIGPKLTQVQWDPEAGVSNYLVYLKDHLVCSTPENNCSIKKLLGPKAQISVVGETNSGALTPPARPTYTPPVKQIEIALTHFNFNSSSLTPADKKILLTLGKEMRGQGFTSLLVVGHTDAIGSAEFNAVLSGKRAQSAFDYLNRLLAKDPVSVTIKKYGFKLPIGDNATSQGRQANRRASIILR